MAGPENSTSSPASSPLAGELLLIRMSEAIQTPFEREVAELLVETLNLEDIEATEIQPEDGLFDGELALDSVDALELALAVSQRYAVQLKAEDPGTRDAFTNLRSLAGFIETHQSATQVGSAANS